MRSTSISVGTAAVRGGKRAFRGLKPAEKRARRATSLRFEITDVIPDRSRGYVLAGWCALCCGWWSIATVVTVREFATRSGGPHSLSEAVIGSLATGVVYPGVPPLAASGNLVGVDSLGIGYLALFVAVLVWSGLPFLLFRGDATIGVVLLAAIPYVAVVPAFISVRDACRDRGYDGVSTVFGAAAGSAVASLVGVCALFSIGLLVHLLALTLPI